MQGQLVPCMHPEPIRKRFINERQCLHAHQAAREAAAAWQVASTKFYVCVAFANYSAPPMCIVRASIARVLRDGLSAASKLFSKSKPGDMTPAAKKLLHTCSNGSGVQHDVKCFANVIDDVGGRQHVIPKEDTRRR